MSERVMSERPDSPLRPLEYRARSDEQSDSKIAGHAVVATLLVAVHIVASVPIVVLLCLSSPAVGFIVGAADLLGIFAWIQYAIRHQHEPAKRGWVIGIWIGFGIGLLAEGLCFGTAMMS